MGHSTQPWLVTGAAGFIGSTFVERAVREGRRIVILDALTYAGRRENLSHVRGPGSWELVEGDIGDARLVEELLKQHRPEAVLNFAAESHVDRSIHAPNAFIHTNIVGVFSLLSCVRDYWSSLAGEEKSRFRFLQVSTDEVYGSLGETGYFSETTAYAPNSPYSASKASADMLVRAWHHTYGLPTLITNCSNNYGPRQFPEKLIPRMILCALTGEALPVYGDGKNVRDWIHVEDHAAGIELAVLKGRVGETYCFGGRSERNNLQVVHGICDELDRVAPRADRKPHASSIRFVEDRLGHDRRYAIDDSKAERELGFTRTFRSFEDGLKATIAWYLEHRGWVEVISKGSHRPTEKVLT